MRRLCPLLLILGLAAPALAQTPVLQIDKLAFDVPTATLAEASANKYLAYLDATPVGVSLVTTCTGTASPFVCKAPIPALTPGAHTVTVSMVVTLPDSRSMESLKSQAYSFTLVVAATPLNLRTAP